MFLCLFGGFSTHSIDHGFLKAIHHHEKKNMSPPNLGMAFVLFLVYLFGYHCFFNHGEKKTKTPNLVGKIFFVVYFFQT